MGTMLIDAVQAGVDAVLLGLRWAARLPFHVIRKLAGADLPTSSVRA